MSEHSCEVLAEQGWCYHFAVHRVQQGNESWVEPPLRHEWPDREKLRWHAAVIAHDAGVPIRLFSGSAGDSIGYWVNGIRVAEADYGLQVGNASTGGMTYGTAWTYLNGVYAGAQAAGGQ